MSRSLVRAWSEGKQKFNLSDETLEAIIQDSRNPTIMREEKYTSMTLHEALRSYNIEGATHAHENFSPTPRTRPPTIAQSEEEP